MLANAHQHAKIGVPTTSGVGFKNAPFLCKLCRSNSPGKKGVTKLKLIINGDVKDKLTF